MSSPHIQTIMEKIDELQALFELGQQTMPFLEELFHFIEEIEPLLDDINSSIRGTTQKLPDAQSKLESVTEATELATTEILDIVDEVQTDLQMLEQAYEQHAESLAELQAADAELLERLEAALGAEHETLAEEASALHDRKAAVIQEIHARAKDERDALATMQQQMTEIMMALQVQDITSQQIAAVNHIIESLRDRMSRMVDHPSITVEQAAEAPQDTGDGTFDGNARYAPTASHQDAADALIDSLKGKSNASEAPASVSAAPDDAPAEEADSGEMATQEDIDELFS